LNKKWKILTDKPSTIGNFREFTATNTSKNFSVTNNDLGELRLSKMSDKSLRNTISPELL
jgi:hypothetical protein